MDFEHRTVFVHDPLGHQPADFDILVDDIKHFMQVHARSCVEDFHRQDVESIIGDIQHWQFLCAPPTTPKQVQVGMATDAACWNVCITNHGVCVQGDAVNCGIITIMSCIYLALGMVPFCDGGPGEWEQGRIPVHTANHWRAWAVTVLASDGALMGVAPTTEQMPRDKVLCQEGGAPQLLRHLYGASSSSAEGAQADPAQPQAGSSHTRGHGASGKPPPGAGRGRRR
jgi:hypothetical protein